MNPESAIEGDEPGFGPTPPLLFNVVYCSRAVAGTDAAAVSRIVAVAQRNNARHGITGMLVFGEGVFFQWLEGPRDAVQRLLALLRSDPRHEQIVLLSEVEETRDRLFPQWDMEQVDAGHIGAVLADALDAAQDPHDAAALRALLAEVRSRGAVG